MVTKFKIKTGDQVAVLAGKDRGKTGKVIQTIPGGNRIAVEGVNQTTKHARARGVARGSDKGQKITFFAPIHVSNLALVCPKCEKPTRIGSALIEGGKKVRVCKKCKQNI